MTTNPLTPEQLAALSYCVEEASAWRGSLPLEERDELDAIVSTARQALHALQIQRMGAEP